MKCQNCGADIQDGSKYCEFCGSKITSDQLKEEEQLNKSGCPKCGSTNVTFSRETTGEVHNRFGSRVVRSTVGLCKDCGYTWTAEETKEPKKKRLWLWVLGWIFIFPVPLTILVLRSEKLKKEVKYIIIALAWLIYFGWMFNAKTSNHSSSTASNNNEIVVESQVPQQNSESVESESIESESVESESTEESATEEPSVEESSEESSEVSSAVTPEFKEAMDSYEAFFDEYVEFMKKYSSSSDQSSLMMDYLNYMTKYTEMMEKMDAIDEKQLSAVDDLYYIEVTARIEKKLLEASATMK